MADSVVSPHQRYSSELAAYTLKQFSAARSALDNHKAAAVKLPAINSYDYRVTSSTIDSSSSSAESSASQSAANDQENDQKDQSASDAGVTFPSC